MKGGSPLPRIRPHRTPRVNIVEKPGANRTLAPRFVGAELRDAGAALRDYGEAFHAGATVQVYVDDQVSTLPASVFLRPPEPAEPFPFVKLEAPDPFQVTVLPGGRTRTTYAPAPIPEPNPPIPDLAGDVLGRHDEAEETPQDSGHNRTFDPLVLGELDPEDPLDELRPLIDGHRQPQPHPSNPVPDSLRYVHEEPPDGS